MDESKEAVTKISEEQQNSDQDGEYIVLNRQEVEMPSESGQPKTI